MCCVCHAVVCWVQIDLSDAGMRALLDEAKSAALAGWSGKQVIHPKQVHLMVTQ